MKNKRVRRDPVAKALLNDPRQFGTKVVQDKKKAMKKGKVKHKNKIYSSPSFFCIKNFLSKR